MATKTSLCALALLSLFLSRQKLVVVSGRRALTKLVSLSLVSSRWSPLFVVVVFVFSTVRPIGCVSDVAAGVVFLFFFFSFVWGRFFSVFLLIQMRKTWWHLESWNDFGKERQKERKKERKRETFRKKKGKKFFESLSLAREEAFITHVRPIKRSRFFVFFSEDLRDDFDDIL